MDEQHGSNQKLQWMSNTDPEKTTIDEQQWPQQKTTMDEQHGPQQKNYNRWATRTQPKTTMDERHGANQKLQ
jgi:hypothetical protein